MGPTPRRWIGPGVVGASCRGRCHRIANKTTSSVLMSSRSTSNEKGAAEEPEPEPGGSLSSSSSTTASYDPTVFQRPHPDDRGGADGTPRKKGDGKAKSKAKAQGKSKDRKGKAIGHCGNCDAEGAKMKCSQCGTEVYCDEKCQRVRSRVSARGGWR